MTKNNKHIKNCLLREKKRRRVKKNVWYNNHKLHGKKRKHINTEKYLRMIMEKELSVFMLS